MKGIIYYTDNRLGNPIRDTARYFIRESGLPIVSCSLKPINFGRNLALTGRQRSYPTFITQIYTALTALDTKYVFFCEHDVLYHKSHFDFTPPKDNVFYYNNNLWRWKLWNFRLVTYEKMRSLSCLCVNREFAVEHYKKRLEKVRELRMDPTRSREPRTARIWGFEPGAKPTSHGGFSDDICDDWRSTGPNIDIRHKMTFTSIKCDPEDYKELPPGFKEIKYYQMKDWDLKALFKDGIKNHTSLDFDSDMI